MRPTIRSQRVGFTMVELLVVVALIIVLAALVFVIAGKGLAAARSVACMSNLRQVGGALIAHANGNNGKLIPLQPSENPDTGRRPPIWTVQLARDGYLWDGSGEVPCGKGLWTCPECDFMSNAYGGYGVVEGSIFVYEENTPFNGDEEGSLRLLKIDDPSRTWLLGDATGKADKVNKGWYAIWANPARWLSHGPAARHGGRANVFMVDGHVEKLTVTQIKDRVLTKDILPPRRRR